MAKWTTIANPLNSTVSTFGGRWGNDLSRYLNGIDMGLIDADKEPRIATNTRYEFGKLKLYDADATHTVEIQPDNIVSGSNRVLRVRALTGTSDYITMDNQAATLQGKTLGINTKLGSILDADQNSIMKIDTVGLRDIDAMNVNFAAIDGTGANSRINILKNYGGILGATDIKMRFGDNSKVHGYEWYSTVSGPNTKLMEILPAKINTYVDLDMNGRNLLNYTPYIEANLIDNTKIAPHTTTKITTTDKTLLNTEIVYKDQPNVFGAHNQTFPSGNFRVSGNGGYTNSLLSGTLAGNINITLPNVTSTLAITTDPRFTDARSPTAHAVNHRTGGSDVIKINEFGAPTANIPATNSTVSANGTLPVLSGDTQQFLNGQGTWSVPTITGGFSGNIKGNIATASGNGTAKIFTIPHGLTTTPATAIVKANSINAFGEFSTTIDATNITVTYQNAPPSGTNNLSFQWIAMDPAANAAGTGEANTYSTVGGGFALTKTKVGVDLPFRSFIAGSTKLSIVQNTNDLTIDVNEANFTTPRPPTAHATSHRSGGTDVIKVNELAAPTTNNTATNSTTTANGTLPMLSGVSTEFLSGAGTWLTPAGGGGGGSNTMSNLVGTTGYVGVYKQKVGDNFEMKSLNVGSNKLSITNDTVNNQVVFDVNQTNLSIDYSQITNAPLDADVVRTSQGNIFGDFRQTFPSASIMILNPLGTFGTIIENSAISGSNKSIILPLITTTTDILVTEVLAQQLANKTLVDPIMTTIKVGADTLTLPVATDRLVGRNTIDTLTNKTLTAPKIATISNNNNTLTLPTTADTLMGRTTTDTVSNKEISLATNTLTESGAVAGGVPIHNGTKYVTRAKGTDGTFLGVQAGVVGYYTPATASAGTMPDGSSIPATGRWGALWGGNLTGMGMIGFSVSYNTTSTDFVSATEAASVIYTPALDDSQAWFNTGGIVSRQSNPVLKAKWYSKQTSNTVIRIGLSSQSTLTSGGGHDSPLNGASGVFVVWVSDIESTYRVARNGGASTDVDVTTSIAANNTIAHTCEINLNTTDCTVKIDGATIGTFTTSLPANTTPLYAWLNIEAIGNGARGLAVSYAQLTML